MDTKSTTSAAQAMGSAPPSRWEGTRTGAGARGRRNSLRQSRKWSPAASGASGASGERAPSGVAARSVPGVPVSSEDMSWPSQCERLAHFNH
jgi:hypothetical protein